MIDISRFKADIKLIVKQDRQENRGKSDWARVSRKISNLFKKSTDITGILSFVVFEYWENEYILNSSCLHNEPTEKHLEILYAMLSFMENTGRDYEPLSSYDWMQLRRLVDESAGDIPADVLNNLRETLMHHGV